MDFNNIIKMCSLVENILLILIRKSEVSANIYTDISVSILADVSMAEFTLERIQTLKTLTECAVTLLRP